MFLLLATNINEGGRRAVRNLKNTAPLPMTNIPHLNLTRYFYESINAPFGLAIDRRSSKVKETLLFRYSLTIALRGCANPRCETTLDPFISNTISF